MEKHQLKSKIGRLSMLAAMMSIIMPSVYAIDDEDQKDLCEDNDGNWVDGRAVTLRQMMKIKQINLLMIFKN